MMYKYLSWAHLQGRPCFISIFISFISSWSWVDGVARHGGRTSSWSSQDFGSRQQRISVEEEQKADSGVLLLLRKCCEWFLQAMLEMHWAGEVGEEAVNCS